MKKTELKEVIKKIINEEKKKIALEEFKDGIAEIKKILQKYI